MYDTARRVAFVKQRVRENTRRRQRREAISLSAFCLMLFTALAGAADALIVRGQTAAWGIRIRNRENQKKAGRTNRTDTNRRRKANEKTNT